MLDQLDMLTNKLLDGELDDSERRHLNELLANEECRIRFVELNKTHCCLSQRLLPTSMRRVARATSAVHESIMSLCARAEVSSHSHDDSVLAVSSSPPKAKARRSLRMAAAIGLAGVGLICCVGLFWQLNQVQETVPAEARGNEIAKVQSGSIPRPMANVQLIPPGGFAARIVSMSEETTWDQDAGPGDFLMRLSVGEELTLSKGLVKLEFASRAIAVLSAPAELKILGPGEVLLKRGKLTGRSEEGDFKVQTPSAYVVDVGTAFGVSVSDEAVTDVVVFDGEVHVRRSRASQQKIRLTSGMSVRSDASGLSASNIKHEIPSFDREFNGERPRNLGTNELSLVDIICGSAPGEYRSAGSIDPEMGTWSTLPWSESKGVQGKLGTGKVVSVDWNPWVHGIFIPDAQRDKLGVDLEGGWVSTPPLRGGAWGPVWARRRSERQFDPLGIESDRDVEGFWGAGTTTALLDRSRWVRDGIVGLHANVGITIDLAAIQAGYATSIKSFRGVLAHLEQSYVSQPFQPQAQATFQIFVDGELRYERKNFCREDGDAMFGAELQNGDRLLSIIVTDGNDGPIYDRVVLLDAIFETRPE